jgi:hypothetical protein
MSDEAVGGNAVVATVGPRNSQRDRFSRLRVEDMRHRGLETNESLQGTRAQGEQPKSIWKESQTLLHCVENFVGFGGSLLSLGKFDSCRGSEIS